MTTATLPAASQRIAIFTIGFAGTSAEEFFETLCRAGVRRLIDVRLNNTSQLAGLTNKRDLAYLLKCIADIEYAHDLALAPTQELLHGYRDRQITWEEYERRFLKLMQARRPDRWRWEELDRACLLCSEPEPAFCHRRLVAEFLARKWGELDIQHL